MIFSIGVICKKLSRMHEFCEDPYSESCVLINGVNEVVSLFFTSLLLGRIWIRMISIQCHWKTACVSCNLVQ